MDTQETVRRHIAALLSGQRFASLSTCNADGHPYASLVAFDADPDLSGMIFATSRATRKFANLSHEPRAAILVDNSGNVKSDIYEAMAVTVLGVTKELSGADQEKAMARYVLKHPHMAKFVEAPSTAVLRLMVDVYYLVNRFQKVMEDHVGR